MLEFKAALRYIKKGGTKTISAIVSVSLAVFLMIIVGIMGSSFITSYRKSIITDEGNYHLKTYDINDEKYEKLKKDERILKICPVSIDIKPDEQIQIFVPSYVNEFFFDEDFIELKKDLLINNISGEIIVLPQGVEKGQVTALYIQLKCISEAYEILDEYGPQFVPNTSVLDTYSVNGMADSSYKRTTEICMFVIGIIAISSILFISNAYMISYNEEKKEARLWTMLGASSAQLVKIIVIKAFIISLVAIFTGGSLGSLVSWLLIRFGGNKMKALTYMTDDFAFYFEPKIFLYVALLTIVVSIIAALRPAISIYRHTGAEGLAGSEITNTYRFKKRTRSNSDNGIYYLLLKRYSRLYLKKNISAIITISIAIILFWSISFVCNHEIADYEKVWNSREYDVKLFVTFDSYDAFEKWHKDNIEMNKLVESSYWYVEAGTVVINADTNVFPPEVIWNGRVPASMYAVEDDVFTEFIGNTDEYDCIIAGNYIGYEKDGEDIKQINCSLFEKEGNACLSIFESNKKMNAKTMAWDDTYKFFNYVIGNAVIIIPYQSIEKYNLEDTKSWNICIWTKNHAQMVEDICETNGYTYLSTNDYANNYQNERNIVFTVEFFGYLIAGMIAIVALSNVILTVYYGITIRKKDFVVLQTLGMKHGQMKKLLFLEATESLTFVIITSIIGFAAIYCIVLRRFYTFIFDIMWQPIVLAMVASLAAYCVAYLMAFFKINKLNASSAIQQV